MAELTDRQQPENPATDLVEQARSLRAELRNRGLVSRQEYSWFAKALILLLTLALLTGAVGLLLFPQERRGLVTALFGERLKPASGDQVVYALPPPPPRTPPTRPTLAVAAGQAGASASDEVGGVLYTPSGPPVPGSGGTPAAAPAPPGFQPPPRTPEAEQALGKLREQVQLIAQLLDGGLDDLQPVGWNPVKSTPPVFWLDVVARRGEQEVHLVWEVDMEKDRVRPLSQAARDLVPR
jgi:hypothetical protein